MHFWTGVVNFFFLKKKITACECIHVEFVYAWFLKHTFVHITNPCNHNLNVGGGGLTKNDGMGKETHIILKLLLICSTNHNIKSLENVSNFEVACESGHVWFYVSKAAFPCKG